MRYPTPLRHGYRICCHRRIQILKATMRISVSNWLTAADAERSVGTILRFAADDWAPPHG